MVEDAQDLRFEYIGRPIKFVSVDSRSEEEWIRRSINEKKANIIDGVLILALLLSNSFLKKP